MLGLDDKLLESKTRRIPRADVAELAVQCLTLPAAANRWGSWAAIHEVANCAPVLPDQKFWRFFSMEEAGIKRQLRPGEALKRHCVRRSFDCITKEPGDGDITVDFAALLCSLEGDCKYGEVSVKGAASAPVLGRA